MTTTESSSDVKKGGGGNANNLQTEGYNWWNQAIFRLDSVKQGWNVKQ
jgi:hypothetical protein